MTSPACSYCCGGLSAFAVVFLLGLSSLFRARCTRTCPRSGRRRAGARTSTRSRRGTVPDRADIRRVPGVVADVLREQQSQGKDVVRVEGRGDPLRGVGESERGHTSRRRSCAKRKRRRLANDDVVECVYSPLRVRRDVSRGDLSLYASYLKIVTHPTVLYRVSFSRATRSMTTPSPAIISSSLGRSVMYRYPTTHSSALALRYVAKPPPFWFLLLFFPRRRVGTFPYDALRPPLDDLRLLGREELVREERPQHGVLRLRAHGALALQVVLQRPRGGAKNSRRTYSSPGRRPRGRRRRWATTCPGPAGGCRRGACGACRPLGPARTGRAGGQGARRWRPGCRGPRAGRRFRDRRRRRVRLVGRLGGRPRASLHAGSRPEAERAAPARDSAWHTGACRVASLASPRLGPHRRGGQPPPSPFVRVQCAVLLFFSEPERRTPSLQIQIYFQTGTQVPARDPPARLTRPGDSGQSASSRLPGDRLAGLGAALAFPRSISRSRKTRARDGSWCHLQARVREARWRVPDLLGGLPPRRHAWPPRAATRR